MLPSVGRAAILPGCPDAVSSDARAADARRLNVVRSVPRSDGNFEAGCGEDERDLGHRPGRGRRSRGAASPGRGHAPRAADAEARADRPLPAHPRRRARGGLHRLPRPPQREPRSDERWDPLRAEPRPRRGPRAGDAQHVEGGAREDPVRRGGWRGASQPAAPERERAPGPDPPLRHRDRAADRSRQRHPGSRRQHRLADDVLDHGHPVDAPRPHDRGLGDRQANGGRRHPRPAERDRPRGASVHHGRGSAPRDSTSRRRAWRSRGSGASG